MNTNTHAKGGSVVEDTMPLQIGDIIDAVVDGHPSLWEVVGLWARGPVARPLYRRTMEPLAHREDRRLVYHKAMRVLPQDEISFQLGRRTK